MDGHVSARRVIASMDRWVALSVMGFILMAPLAAWTMLRRTSAPASTRQQIALERTPSARPAAPTAFVIEPIIRPPAARSKSSSLSPTVVRTKKRAPSNRQWVASLSRPMAHRRSPTPGHGPLP